MFEPVTWSGIYGYSEDGFEPVTWHGIHGEAASAEPPPVPTKPRVMVMERPREPDEAQDMRDLRDIRAILEEIH